MNSEYEIADWTITRWNCLEHDAYFDPDSLRLQDEVDIYRQDSSNEWLHIETIHAVFVHGVELSEHDKYLLDMAIHDYRRSLPEYRAHIRSKRRRKIQAKQKRAAFRRRKR
jgi:hypothetical protein